MLGPKETGKEGWWHVLKLLTVWWWRLTCIKMIGISYDKSFIGLWAMDYGHSEYRAVINNEKIKKGTCK